jgi:hypothetical protein
VDTKQPEMILPVQADGKLESPPTTTEIKPAKHAYPPDRLEDYAEITRNLISQENARLNERTTWLLQLHGFLFAALAFAWEKDSFVVLLLSAVGILSSLAIGNSLRWASRAMDDIEEEWNNKGKAYEGPRIIGMSGEKEKFFERKLLLHPPYRLPIILTMSWVAVLLFQIFS